MSRYDKFTISTKQLADLAYELNIHPEHMDYVPDHLQYDLADECVQHAINEYSQTREQVLADRINDLKHSIEGKELLKSFPKDADLLNYELQESMPAIVKLDTKDGSERYIYVEKVKQVENYAEPIMKFITSNQQIKEQLSNPQEVMWLVGKFKINIQEAAQTVFDHVPEKVKQSSDIVEYVQKKGIHIEGVPTSKLEVREVTLPNGQIEKVLFDEERLKEKLKNESVLAVKEITTPDGRTEKVLKSAVEVKEITLPDGTKEKVHYNEERLKQVKNLTVKEITTPNGQKEKVFSSDADLPMARAVKKDVAPVKTSGLKR
ncbi:T-complex 10 C-terminal domain-containing protein [Burkholderia cenocepacia]|uniref:T-complex 10 C-terminal domain-containing protein n=1 Tax=Burkholderia cenocepacia TaxID=95486 RepID=UPI00222F97F7|nr:T-complex 10 C-terminal domain-containing protein [Burkholderia cenocepacia]MCW3498645.1 hypothetical protein [Burkholderia cenocepacia]MCW3506267.1 hypothetical protein [Burkholderia cenocepacia]MCW3513798.1 hypothetical protein [Burkholderia cenocepacia]MCW3528948.1 hypothetical protein [Burkholderia cenocepacia]MCW3544718.1 hypothetical protein [Burkholderia cenocepacia]